MENKGLIRFVGLFFLILGFLAFTNSLLTTKTISILWFCYLGIFLIGVGMLLKNPILIISQLNILAISQLIWIADFFHFVITGASFLGIVDYFFNPNFPILSRLISTQHIFTIPLSLLVLYKMRPQTNKIKYAWIISLIQLILVFVITRLLSNPTININCVYHSCGNLYSGPTALYPFVWFAVSFILAFLTNFIIYNLIGIKDGKRR